MNALEQIVEKLKNYPALSYRTARNTISVDLLTTDGFIVSLEESGDEIIVSFDGWHEHFPSPDEAAECFCFGLSDRCRLRIDYRGSFAYRWTVEARKENGWQEDSTTGLLLFPFWRTRRVVYRQNALIGGSS